MLPRLLDQYTYFEGLKLFFKLNPSRHAFLAVFFVKMSIPADNSIFLCFHNKQSLVFPHAQFPVLASYPSSFEIISIHQYLSSILTRKAQR